MMFVGRENELNALQALFEKSRTRLRRRFAGCRCARAFLFARHWSILANSIPWLKAMPISTP